MVTITPVTQTVARILINGRRVGAASRGADGWTATIAGRTIAAGSLEHLAWLIKRRSE